MTEMTMHVEALLTGAPVPFRGVEQSAIAKRPVEGRVCIGFLGLAGDSQADRSIPLASTARRAVPGA